MLDFLCNESSNFSREFFMYRVVFLGSLLFLTGCGTIMNSSVENLILVSDEQDAIVTITDDSGNVVARGEMPLTVVLNKKGKKSFSRPVYGASMVSGKKENSMDVVVKPVISPWFWANIPLTLGIGMLVDGVTGGMWTFRNKKIVLNQKQEVVAPSKEKNPMCQPVTKLTVLAVQDKYVLVFTGRRKAFLPKEEKTVYYDDMFIPIPKGKCVSFVDSRPLKHYRDTKQTYYNETERKQGINRRSEQVEIQGETVETLPVIKFVDVIK